MQLSNFSARTTKVLALSAIVIAACTGKTPDQPAPESASVAFASMAALAQEHLTTLNIERPECPESWDSVPLFIPQKAEARAMPAGGTAPSTASLQLLDPITDIPEFHDCQRFIETDSTFGPLFAIFASPRLDSLGRALQFDSVRWQSSDTAVVRIMAANGRAAAGTSGSARMRATSLVDAGRTIDIPVTVAAVPPPDSAYGLDTLRVPVGSGVPFLVRARSNFSVAAPLGRPTTSSIAAGIVYTYGGGYLPLGIGPNFNCLYVYFDAAGRLAAKMVHAPDLGRSVQACDTAADPRAPGGKELTVYFSTSGVRTDYPSVARWDYDTVNAQYHIGIQCGNGWCDIGAPKNQRPFRPSPNIHASTITTPADRRVTGIKGWYDQQNLAFETPAGTVPSGIIGTVVPHPDLGRRSDQDYLDRWLVTGYVALDIARAKPGAVAYYKTKFNFDGALVTSGLSALNIIEICLGTATTCSVPPPPTGGGCGVPSTGNPRPILWARITGATPGRPMFRCITLFSHSGMAAAQTIFATARWRWVLSDEGIWEYCPDQHCCQVGSGHFGAGWF